VLQSVAECCSVLQSVAECCRVLQCVAVCCSVLQSVAECCRVWHEPQTEEIGLKIITTAKKINKFSQESPYISNMFSRESTNFHTSFHVCKRSPRHSQDLSLKLIDIEIQIF